MKFSKEEIESMLEEADVPEELVQELVDGIFEAVADEEGEKEEVALPEGYPAKLTVSRQYKGESSPWYDAEEDEDEEGETEKVIEVMRFPEGVAPAHVSATMGLTINLGDYESAKISVTTTLPCYAEEIEDAYEAAKNFSGEKMLDEKKFIEDSVIAKKRR